jgi:hypothetical protein
MNQSHFEKKRKKSKNANKYLESQIKIENNS